MRLLKDLLYKSGAIELIGSTNLAITAVTADSRMVLKDGLFVAVKGARSDGHQFIDIAIEKGAIAIVCEQMPAEVQSRITYVCVKDSAYALGIIASNFYDNPSAQLILTGVTGTNGKTTTATLLFELFTKLGFKCGLISTVKNQIDGEIIPSTHTTPDAVQLQQLLHNMVKAGCSHAFMEVSSHAADQQRIAGATFALGVFTNITHDHLDYHITFDNYLHAKQKFFTQLGSGANALVNLDDPNADQLVETTRAKVHTYGLRAGADFHVRILEKQLNGMMLRINGQEVWSPIIGNFNAYNLAAVYGAAILLGQESIQVLTAMSSLRSVEGRFQHLQSDNGVTAIVDYAHTPDALRNVLSTIRDIRTGNEQVITLIGCGGDRDAAKRPEMARIAAEMSDRVILTSDNPRSEDPDEIISQMKAGVEAQHKRRVLSITDRREAIRAAFALAGNGDIMLIAGKGHEKYQEIKGVKHPFDDMEEVRQTFKTANS
jgi:UDP-N-acetylmuramoyl-L-alanyl-D-glutamate--2,6-diaminopimelate ligase